MDQLVTVCLPWENVTDWCLPGESWLPVPRHEGSYEGSDFGRSRSRDRWVRYSDGRRRWHEGQILQPVFTDQGYLSTGIPHDPARLERKTQWLSHRLVAHLFIGPRPDGMEVRHLNGVRTDSRLTNLTYGTSAENGRDKVLHKKHPFSAVTHCPYNHPLVDYNLVRSMLPGQRACKACARARVVVRNARLAGLTLSHQAVSDEKYAAIVARLAS